MNELTQNEFSWSAVQFRRLQDLSAVQMLSCVLKHAADLTREISGYGGVASGCCMKTEAKEGE